MYLPQMIKGLLKMPLFIPTAPSISVSIIADVPMTMLFSDRSRSRQVLAVREVYFKYCLLYSSRSYVNRISQELTSPSLFFTIVLTASVSYCISLSPTGRI